MPRQMRIVRKNKPEKNMQILYQRRTGSLYKPGPDAYKGGASKAARDDTPAGMSITGETMSLMSILRFCAVFCLGGVLFGCATRPVIVVEKEEFVQMARHMPRELQARRLLDSDGSYVAPFSLASFSNYGDTLFRRLSPSFLFDDSGHVYLGENFAATLQPDSRVTRRPNGFTINHATQKLTVSMVAIADWNNDGEDEWIVSCLVEPERGGRTRTYYVLVPPPRNAGEALRGTVAAVWECFGLACNLYVRDSKALERAAADPLLPATEIQDVTPGLQTVTEPPKKNPAGNDDGLEERSL